MTIVVFHDGPHKGRFDLDAVSPRHFAAQFYESTQGEQGREHGGYFIQHANKLGDRLVVQAKTIESLARAHAAESRGRAAESAAKPKFLRGVAKWW